MEIKINIAELLKSCPSGMELDCTMWDNLYFDRVDNDLIHCYYELDGHRNTTMFCKDGCYTAHKLSKCVIFPKGKTTWEGFIPPCKFKDGDVLYVDCADNESDGDLYKYIFILKEIDSLGKYFSYCYLSINRFSSQLNFLTDNRYTARFATEEEKQKLFDAIKANGYHWNAETKTLEKLPKFKVGDRIKYRYFDRKIAKVVKIHDKRYELDNGQFIEFQDENAYEISYDKFDITTLKPFESKVLIRDYNDKIWVPTFWGKLLEEDSNCRYLTSNGCYKYCIPYEGNEHLLGTTNDCDDFYKTWE